MADYRLGCVMCGHVRGRRGPVKRRTCSPECEDRLRAPRKTATVEDFSQVDMDELARMTGLMREPEPATLYVSEADLDFVRSELGDDDG